MVQILSEDRPSAKHKTWKHELGKTDVRSPRGLALGHSGDSHGEKRVYGLSRKALKAYFYEKSKNRPKSEFLSLFEVPISKKGGLNHCKGVLMV